MSSKSVEFHLIDTGHFALDEMVPQIHDFLGRKVARK